MKKLSLLFLVSLIIYNTGFPQCPGYLIINLQEQIDAFPIEYPNCSEFEGYIIITGDNITNLLGLSNLTSIGGYFSIQNNPLLTSLSGLENLTTVNDYFAIASCPSLTNLDGLENLSYIGGYQFAIGYNDSLVSLANFSNMEHIEGSLIIINNKLLTNLIGFDHLNSVGSSVEINNNLALTDFTGLESLTTVSGSLDLSQNYFLQDISALGSLTSIGENLMINKCNSLIDLSGLINVTSIGGSLEISENNMLESLSGIDSIEAGTINNLTINFNPFLSTCDVHSICSYLSDPNGDISIYGNSTGCNNYLEVEEACTVSLNENVDKNTISYFPNPTSNTLNVCGITEMEIIEIRIYNHLGQNVKQVNSSFNPIDVSDLKQGLYVIEVLANDVYFRDKLVIE